MGKWLSQTVMLPCPIVRGLECIRKLIIMQHLFLRHISGSYGRSEAPNCACVC